MVRLNIPYVVTIVMDYAWMSTFWLFAYAVASSSDGKLAPLAAAACVAFTIVVNSTREQLYSIVLRPYLAKGKTDFRMANHPDYWSDVVVTSLYLIAIGYVGAILGIMHCRFDSVNVWNTVLTVSMDYWLVNIVKDNISMRYIHPWMHKRENYWIHKRHHLGNKDMCFLPGAFVFDLLDLTVEFGVGSVLALLVKYFILGTEPSIHILSFMFAAWTDGNVHSMNPYSQAVGNPLLDWRMKLTVVHNLHHAVPTDPKYMTVFPMHQLFSSASLQEDVQLYNRIMKTNVNFQILLDD